VGAAPGAGPALPALARAARAGGGRALPPRLPPHARRRPPPRRTPAAAAPPARQVELQLEAQDGSLVETQYGVVAAFGALPSVNRSAPVRLVAADPLDACGPLAAPLDGGVALARRGGCSFVAKYLAVLAAGGSAMLMFNDAPGEGGGALGGSRRVAQTRPGCSAGALAAGAYMQRGARPSTLAHASPRNHHRRRPRTPAGCISMGGTLDNATTGPPPPASKSVPAISIDHDLGLRLVNASAAGQVTLVSVALLDLPPIDAGAALLWIMAVLTVAAGGLWAGADHAAALKAAAADADADAAGGRRARGSSGGGGPGDAVLDVTAAGAVAFVGLASTMLLLLYFFMNKAFFYVILGLFTFSGAQALGVALAAGLAAAAPALEGRALPVPWLGDVPLPALVAAPPAAAVALGWLVFRSAPWSWPLLDALGIALMLFVLRTLRLGGLRVACILLPLCFAYDVFFVFLQPLLFGGGESVMVEVARGAGADEMLPMLLRVPRLSGPPIARGGYSMLGFGDVILPGLLVALMRRVDIDARRPWPRGYFAPTVVAYGAGLVLTYVALAFSWFGDQGQPALLYLVPCTLGTVLALAAARRELGPLWRAGDGGGGGPGSEWALLLPGGGGAGGGGEDAAEFGSGGAGEGGAWRPAGGRPSSGGSGGSGGGGSARSSPTASRAHLLSRPSAGGGGGGGARGAAV
jgi:signal peptide peptidase-like protein 2B